MILCVLCNAFCRSDFCPACDEALRRVELRGPERIRTLPGGGSVLSSMAYRGLGRSCILACKTEGFRRLGQALARRAWAGDELKELVGSCDVIMPAPSSLWSRWRGSLDLAAMVAEDLAREAGILVRWPPWALSFRWKKQALRVSSQRRRVFRSHQKIYDASYFARHQATPLRSARLKVLVVDDVVTSGSTLDGLAACFAGIDFKFYTLASALRSGKDDHAEYHSRRIATTDPHDASGL